MGIEMDIETILWRNYLSHMLHVWNIYTNIYPKNCPNVKYLPTFGHLGIDIHHRWIMIRRIKENL